MFNLLTVTELGKDGLKTAYTALEGFTLWLTVALAGILLVAFILIRFFAKDKMSGFKTLAFGIVIGYAITITLCISFFMIARLKIKGEIDTNFYLILGFLSLALLYAVSSIFMRLLSKKAFTIYNYICIGLMVAYAVVLLIILPTVEEAYEPLSTAGMYSFTIALIAITTLLAVLFGKDTGSANTTKAISYAGVCIALSFALSYVKLFSLPQGGSITLASMLPLIIYAYVFGARKGVLAGVIYGILQCIQSPQIYQPLQVLIDYPIAFGVLGLAGIVKNLNFLKTPLIKFIVGATLACVMRYLAHVISGTYVFSTWAEAGYSALGWGVVYNLFIIAELGIILLVGCFLFTSKGFNKQLNTINPIISTEEKQMEN